MERVVGGMTRHDGNGDDTVEFLLDCVEVGTVEAEERLACDQITLQTQFGLGAIQPLSHPTPNDCEAAEGEFFSPQMFQRYMLLTANSNILAGWNLRVSDGDLPHFH